MSLTVQEIGKTTLRFQGFLRESSAKYLFLGLLLLPAALYAADVGDVRGVVHDSQHVPIAQAQVALKASASEWVQTTTTDSRGEFVFTTVPLGDYFLTVTHADFAAASLAPVIEATSSSEWPSTSFRMTALRWSAGSRMKVLKLIVAISWS